MRAELGSRLLILGHHYQQDEVIALSDLQGDSYQLSRMAADSRDCRFIAFCGVHFMAETADIVANRPEKLAERGGERVTVVLPDMAAGCSMADMAAIDQVESCWEELGEVIDTTDITPVTYINSAASLKAFCGRHGGIVCTSSNAAAVLKWAFKRTQSRAVFPRPTLGAQHGQGDGHSADANGRLESARRATGRQHAARRSRIAKVLLWQGHCSVHAMFRPEHVDAFRAKYPGIKVLVHPECSMEVVDKSDVHGSTSKIIRTVEAGRAGHEMGDRHRIAFSESPQARASGAGNSLPLAGRVHVRHDVPDRPGPLVLELGKSGRRHSGERHPGRSRDSAVGARGAGADAGGEVNE